MVDEHGLVKVLDFGLAKLTESAPLGEDEPTRTLKPATEEGTILGTVAYMSPEQAEGKRLDARSDIFSFGSLLYEMVTGKRAFQGDSKMSTLAAILTQEPGPLPPAVPHDLEKIIGRCLRKDAAHRFQHMADLKVALEELKEDSDSGKLTAAQVPAHPRKNRFLWSSLAAAAVLVLTAAGVLVWQRMQARPLTDKDVLVLADFTNSTGDAVFDGTLREALAVQLEQSPFLKVLGDAPVRQSLGLMGRSTKERVTNDIAREICQREGEKATIGGSIASLGKTYAITLQATNCQTGEALAREQVEAEDKEHVLRAVATAATRMRAKLGESLASIQKLDVPNQQVTTTSLEAFQAYALGRVQYSQGLWLAAIPLYQRATELDPNFASAYLALAVGYSNAGEGARAASYRRKAFALIDRVSERERLNISADYYPVTGELGKQADAWQLFARTYPREWTPHNRLGLIYANTGDHERAVQEYQEAIRLEPRFTPAVLYSNLVTAYANLERFDEAKTVAERAFAQKLEAPSVHLSLLRIAYIQGDRTEAEKQIQWLAGKPQEYESLTAQATNAAALGQLRTAGELLGRASEMAKRLNLPETAARHQSANARDEALVGSCEAARAKARAAILPDQAPADAAGAALPLALCGDAAAAQKVADEMSKRFPLHTIWNAVYLPSIRAAIELRQDQPAKAIELLQSATPYERPYPEPVYLRGLAYLRARKGAEATAEFQKILDNKGANWGPYYPLSYVGLARAAALTGDSARARKAYQDLLALWKDADPDIPILKEAKQEYAKLK
jgi:tetratricopeptide (TPR) repeat protein